MDEKNGYSEVHVMHIQQTFTFTMNQVHRSNQKHHGIICALHPQMWKH